MAGSISRSFRLLGVSWNLLGKDPKLLFMPLTSLVLGLRPGASGRSGSSTSGASDRA